MTGQSPPGLPPSPGAVPQATPIEQSFFRRLIAALDIHWYMRLMALCGAVGLGAIQFGLAKGILPYIGNEVQGEIIGFVPARGAGSGRNPWLPQFRFTLPDGAVVVGTGIYGYKRVDADGGNVPSVIAVAYGYPGMRVSDRLPVRFNARDPTVVNPSLSFQLLMLLLFTLVALPVQFVAAVSLGHALFGRKRSRG